MGHNDLQRSVIDSQAMVITNLSCVVQTMKFPQNNTPVNSLKYPNTSPFHNFKNKSILLSCIVYKFKCLIEILLVTTFFLKFLSTFVLLQSMQKNMLCLSR